MSLEVNIRKSFPSFALDVEFQASDETLGFLGASGCGKSLTMRCIAGIETPDEGRIVVNGKVFYDSERKINLKPQERKTALLFQNYMLFPNFTAAENVGAGIGRVVPKAERRSIVEAELKRFGLESFANRFPAQLSGGQQQRVALARMLAARPGILMLDEPFSALDAHLKSVLEQNLVSLFDAFHGTVLYVSHDIVRRMPYRRIHARAARRLQPHRGPLHRRRGERQPLQPPVLRCGRHLLGPGLQLRAPCRHADGGIHELTVSATRPANATASRAHWPASEPLPEAGLARIDRLSGNEPRKIVARRYDRHFAASAIPLIARDDIR